MKVQIRDNSLFIKGKRQFIFSGEVHYFRLKKKDWHDRIKKAKKANLNTISSYIPWIWHSPAENTVDFKGQSIPERDLVYFLELLKKEKIYFIARIGPVCNGEIIDDGLPQWLFKNYPQIRLKDFAGRTNPYSSLIDYHHPIFHKLIKTWYDSLLSVLKPYLYDNGPIILIQLDNEISMLNWLTKSPNYSEAADVLFQDYLKKEYKDLSVLNKKMGTDYTDFASIQQPQGDFNRARGAFQFEWEDFYRDYYALYYQKLYCYMKEQIGDHPVIANIPQIYDYDVKGRGNMGIMTTSMFKKFSLYVKDVIFGGAYQYRRLDYENFTDISAMTEIVRMITPQGNPMICAEMQSGIMFDRPILYPSDVELNIKTSIGTGLNGINCYMFAGGQNFGDHLGGFGHYHNWQAAVSADGKESDHYLSIKKSALLMKNFADLVAETKNYHQINIGLYLPYYQTEYLKGEVIDELMVRRDNKLFDGLLRLIKLAGFQYRFIDLEGIPPEEMERLDNLWIFALEFMDPETQRKITDYIEREKNLLFYPTIPSLDLNFRDCTVLKDHLGIKTITHRVGANRVKKFKDRFLFYGGDEIQYFEMNDNRVTPLFYSQEEKLVAFEINKSSRIIVCGFDLTHKFDYQIDFVEDFARRLNIKKDIINNNRRVNIEKRSSDDLDILFISNYTEMPQKARINIKGRPFPQVMSLTLPGRKGLILFTNFQAGEDLFLYYITAEITRLVRKKGSLILKLKNDSPDITLCYRGPYQLTTRSQIAKKGKYIFVRINSCNEEMELTFKRKR
ncbi:MAG: beta-galactosidase [Spirochaetes bacterium]|nr:beta-galactosidase [Spirochaetota bacterium]